MNIQVTVPFTIIDATGARMINQWFELPVAFTIQSWFEISTDDFEQEVKVTIEDYLYEIATDVKTDANLRYDLYHLFRDTPYGVLKFYAVFSRPENLVELYKGQWGPKDDIHDIQFKIPRELYDRIVDDNELNGSVQPSDMAFDQFLEERDERSQDYYYSQEEGDWRVNDRD